MGGLQLETVFHLAMTLYKLVFFFFYWLLTFRNLEIPLAHKSLASNFTCIPTGNK